MNVVDSCGWLEYIADGPNASFFEPVLADLPKLVVPAITIYEVCKRILLQRDQADADQWDGRPHLGGIVMCQSGGVYQPT
jgi:hypothetical protein